VKLPLTVFASSVRLDLARLWLACMRRAFPDPGVRIVLYDDSGRGGLRDDLLPGADVIGPAAGRRDFQEAYNDVLLRAATPLLVLADTDVFWTSTGFHSSLEERFADPAVAAVSFVSREGGQGHGTFAVAMRTAAYRAALADVPDGFFPRVDGEEGGPPPGRWRGHDTGDLLMRAVVARGGVVRLLRHESGARFARFDALTNVHLLRTFAGEAALLALARSDAYLREGCLGNLALRPAYRRLFPDGPAFEFPTQGVPFFRSLASSGPRELARAAARYLALRAGARRVAGFLSTVRPS
jgi:hypothetical protein